LEIPFGPLPGGSGDGFIASILHRSNEPNTIESAVFTIAKNQHKKIDVMSLERPQDPKTIYSFLSFTWA